MKQYGMINRSNHFIEWVTAVQKTNNETRLGDVKLMICGNGVKLLVTREAFGYVLHVHTDVLLKKETFKTWKSLESTLNHICSQKCALYVRDVMIERGFIEEEEKVEQVPPFQKVEQVPPFKKLSKDLHSYKKEVLVRYLRRIQGYSTRVRSIFDKHYLDGLFYCSSLSEEGLIDLIEIVYNEAQEKAPGNLLFN